MQLTDDNIILFAAKNYTNTNCHDIQEFYTDLFIPSHLKKLFTRYSSSGTLKENLIINHIICFYNVFTPIGATKILFYKIDKKYHSYLKTFLVFLGRIDDTTTFRDLNLKDINLDNKLYDYLVNNI